MKYIRTNSLKRLFSLKSRSFEQDHNESYNIISETEPCLRPSWKCFSFQEIFVATNCFSSANLVGKGGHAEVYRGVLENGEEIAVKMLTKASTDERKEKEF